MTHLDIHSSEHGPSHERTAVLLHSSGLSGAQWRMYLKPLAEVGWRTIAVDFIGCGQSAPWSGAEPFGHRHDVAQVVSLLRTLAGQPYAIVGHSYGGLVGLQAALDPEVQPSAMVLFEPVAWGVVADSPEFQEMRRSMIDSGFFDDAQGGSEAWMQRFVEYWNGPGAWVFMGERGRANMMRSARVTFEQVRSTAFDETPLGLYRDLPAPMHLMCGDQSPEESQEISRRLAGLSESNTLTEVSGGHMSPVLDPSAVVPIVCAKLSHV
ncbi:MAG: alpha/beta fold hydrolase [Bradymonadia bacterium]